MGTQGAGRKRNPNKERSTAEDDALNLIAREAEARLAAKRAARAEAREIRMKELERQQKEVEPNASMSYGENYGSRAASALTAGTLTSLGGTSSRRGSGETAITVDTETSIREIKEIHELKDQIQDVESKYMQNLKEVKDALVEVEEKYRKAMVSNAQLDNEKNNLMYQVDTLKDSLMELEELLSESRREYEEKLKDFEREKHAHSVLQFQFSEMKETLKQSEELLNKHGIVLGPDLNVNGDVVEAETEGSSSGEPATHLAQESKTSPTEGNSMLGSVQETQLRSSGEDEVDPDQHQGRLEEAKERDLSSATPCNLASASMLETSREEQQAHVPTVEGSVGESGLSDDIDNNNHFPITDAKNITICNSEFQEIVTSPEEKDTGAEEVELGDVGETSKVEIGAEKVSIGDSETLLECSDDIKEACNDLSEEQVNTLEEVEASQSTRGSTDSCSQEEVVENIMKVSLPDDSTPATSNTEPQHEPENAEEAENEELEEISNKSQPQGAAATGKKKKKKRKGKKKKGGTREDEKQKNDAKEKCVTEKENGKTKKDLETDKDLESATRDNGPATEPAIADSPVETLKESRMDQVKDEQDKQHILHTEEVEAVESVMSPNTESNLSTTNLIDNSKSTESTNDHDGECTSNVDNSKEGIDVPTKTGVVQVESEIIDSATDEVGSVNEVELECTTNNAENSFETASTMATIEAKSQDPSNADAAADESESTNNSESKENKLEASSNTDIFFDCLEVPVESNQSTTVNSGSDDAITVSVGGPLEEMETVKDEEEPVVEVEQKSASCIVTAAVHDDHDHSEPRLEEAGKEELNGDLREPEDSLQPDNSSMPFSTDGDKSDNESSVNYCDAFVAEKSFSETANQAEHLDDVSSCPVESQDLNSPLTQNDESNDEVSLETEESDTITILQTTDSAKKVVEIGSFVEQDDSDGEPAIAEDPEHQNSQDEQESAMSPCPMEKQQHESNKDEPEDKNSSQPPQQDSDEEDDEDEEGQSFDFDDVDMEAAVAVNVALKMPQEEVEKGVEVTSEEDGNGNSVPSQCDIETNEDTESQLQTQEEPVESNEEKCRVDEGSKVDTQDEELGSESQDDPTRDKEESTSEKGGDECEEQQNTVEKEIGVVDEPKHISEGGEVGNVGELGVVESNSVEEVNQELSLRVEEGEDAIKQELQGEKLVTQNPEDQVGSNVQPPLSGKDLKKNGKKGKSKGKEDCKMSYPPPSISLAPPTPEIRLRKLVDEREKMIEQVKKLKAQLEQKTQRNGTESASSPDGEILENGTDPNILELQRDANRHISDLKFKLVKAEQEVTALEQNVTRLEGQVTRYKSASENAEKVEDELKAEKRKLQRELRSALDKVDELESNNSHLSKRLEKMKTNRGTAQTP
ncbi:dentin sialophosphoprotein [Centroberyx affinis]|uniref:dentin sialophosphoprotein n=1 Tax=Centroberyx affinis TaxID=166261 RepID=UPI003A5BCA5A